MWLTTQVTKSKWKKQWFIEAKLHLKYLCITDDHTFWFPFQTWLSTRKAQSQCSRVVWVYSTALYGSTMEVDTCS